MTERDKKIIADSEAAGIPIFVFTAKDKISSEILEQYRDWASEDGCNTEFVAGIGTRLTEFLNWQASNSNLVKLPD